MGAKIAVIADDLTGANDTGVQFAKQGLDTLVLMEIASLSQTCPEHVVVVNTNSRGDPSEHAYLKLTRAARLLKGHGFEHIYKKVDSTFRGNIGPEIDAMMDVCGHELAIVAPAFPKNDRVTVGGYHLIKAIPLEATETARDLRFPVRESHLPTLLSTQTRRKVGHLGVKNLIEGPDSIFSRLQELVAEGCTILVCDVWHNEHFGMIAAAALRLGKRVLWVGSAGMAEYLPQVLGLKPSPVKRAPVLIIAGSVSQVTRNQVGALQCRADVACIEVDPLALLSQQTQSTELERCFNAAAAAAGEGRDVVLVSGESDEIVAATIAAGASLGMDGPAAGEIVAHGLGRICKRLAIGIHLGGLILTGGDTAVASCRSMEATGLMVFKEIAPGIPLGVLKGGPWDGMRVVTKAGAFGDRDALLKALDCLRQLFTPIRSTRKL